MKALKVKDFWISYCTNLRAKNIIFLKKLYVFIFINYGKVQVYIKIHSLLHLEKKT